MNKMSVVSLCLSISTFLGSAIDPECQDHNNTTKASQTGKRGTATMEALRRRTCPLQTRSNITSQKIMH